MSNVDKESTDKTKQRNAARKLKKQEEIAKTATEAKNIANVLAANLTQELKVKHFIVDSIVNSKPTQ